MAVFSLTVVMQVPMQEVPSGRQLGSRPGPVRGKEEEVALAVGEGLPVPQLLRSPPGGGPMGTMVILITELTLAGTFYFERLRVSSNTPTTSSRRWPSLRGSCSSTTSHELHPVDEVRALDKSQPPTSGSA